VAVYCKRPDLLAAKASIIMGAAAWFIWALFVNSRYAAVFGLSKEVLGYVSALGYYGRPWIHWSSRSLCQPSPSSSSSIPAVDAVRNLQRREIRFSFFHGRQLETKIAPRMKQDYFSPFHLLYR
jgi:hypothetical protein